MWYLVNDSKTSLLRKYQTNIGVHSQLESTGQPYWDISMGDWEHAEGWDDVDHGMIWWRTCCYGSQWSCPEFIPHRVYARLCKRKRASPQMDCIDHSDAVHSWNVHLGIRLLTWFDYVWLSRSLWTAVMVSIWNHRGPRSCSLISWKVHSQCPSGFHVHIAMENGPFMVDLPIKSDDFQCVCQFTKGQPAITGLPKSM